MAKIVLTIAADNKATQSVKLLNAEVKTLSQTLSSITVNKNLTEQINALSKYYANLEKAAVKVNKVTSERQLIESKIATQEAKTATEKARKLTQLKQEALLTEKANTEISKQNNLNARTEKTTSRLAQEKEKAAQATQKQTSATKANTIVNNNNTQSIGSMTVNIFKWQLAMTSVMKPLRLLQDAVASLDETLVETEDRVVALQRVVGDVANANELYDLAAKYGQEFENVSEAVLNFARRGMSWNESLKATEAALLAINVAELDVGEATDGLGAIMAQFGIQASELTNVVDMLNKTADKFPVTTSKILSALQRTGSTASTANLSLEETIGLITTLSKATNRSGENIGTALNSILNIAQKDSSLETFSKLSSNVAQIVEQYRGGGTSILEVLRAVSTEVQNLNTNQIFDSEAFNALNEDLKESMGEDFEMLSEIYGTAGTYRRNYFIALLNDLDTVKQVENEISTAQGYSQAENQKYLDTYTAKTNRLNAEWQALVNNEQGWLGFKKDLVDTGVVVLKVVDGVGGLKIVVVATGLVLNKIFAGQIYSALLKFNDGIGRLNVKFTTLFKNIKSKDAWKDFFTAPKKSLDNLTKATEQYRKAQQLQQVATEAQTKATDLQVIADEKAAIATELKAVNKQAETVTSEMATAAEETQTAATEAQTLATEAQTIASQKAAVAEKALATASKEMGAAASAAAGIWGILAFAIYEVVTMLDKGIAEWTKDTTQEQLDKAKETVNAFTEVTDKYNEQINAVKNYADVIKNINGVLSDENSSAIQLEYANNQLLSIQNELIKSNEEYAKSLDLVNGKLDEQSEIVREKSEEEAKKIAKEYLERNSGAVAEAQKVIQGVNSKIELGNGTVATKYGEIDILTQAISSLGLNNANAEVWREGGTAWSVGLLPIINEAMEAADGQKSFSFLNMVERQFTDFVTKEGWTGKSIARLNLSGSTTEQLEAIEKLRTSIYDKYKDASGKVIDTEAQNVLAALESQYQALNSVDYQNALKTIEANDMYSQYVSGGISLSQFQKWLAGDKEWATTWINSLEHLSEVEKNNLVSAMEEARDLQKEALELSEKQLAVEEARVALQNAQNQATVRRFNEATGQWEWQVDEKKVAEAQEKLNEAQKNLSEFAEDKAWSETTGAIKEGNATNKSILDILAKWAEVSMEENPEFVDEIKGIIQATGGVNVDENGVKVSADGTQEVETYKQDEPKQSTAFKKAQEYIDTHGLKESERTTWSKDKEFADLLSDLTTDEFMRLKGTYDSGGIANGLGFMAKATAKPESVNDPELTRKILTPVSNREFETYTKQLGIMFEQAHNYARMPQFERVNNTTDNRVDNSRQINFAGGLTVGADKRGSSIDELLTLTNIVPRN